jgi:ankyrin repeat protein
MNQQVQFNPKISAAIRDRNFSAFKKIIEEDPPQIQAFTPFAGGTWLHFSAREGDIQAVKFLISLGLDVNVGDARDGRAAICDASLGNHKEIVEFLLEAGSILDVSDPVRNPLFCAIIGRSLPIVKLLLSWGIDSEARFDGPSMKQMDAVAFALERGETSIAEEIARWTARGDEKAIAQAIDRAMNVAKMNNKTG